MKILFLCGSLELGQDGVGDYTRRLAGELIRQGHQTFVAAINDRQILEKIEGTQVIEGTSIPIIRLPSVWVTKRLFFELNTWINANDPEWISLQYVPFSFHAKGLPFNLAKHLQQVIGNRKLHLMFHELWVGMEEEASIKVVWWGKFQKIVAQLLIRRLKPLVVHTQTELYKEQLKNIGSNVQVLPLFSNIPIFHHGHLVDKYRVRSNRVVFVFFGSLQRGAPIIDFAKDLAEFSSRERRSIKVIFIGRNGIEVKKWVAALTNHRIEVEEFGEISFEEISEKLSISDVGVSTTPFAQIEKSGTVAAMREHGLDVICAARPWTPRGIKGLSSPPDIIEYKVGKLGINLNIIKPRLKICMSSEVSTQLIKALLNSKDI